MNKVSVQESADIIRAGGTVLIPTETVYGMACDAANSEAIENIQKFKGRITNKPFPILCPSIEMISTVTDELNQMQTSLIQAYWPGPLTILFQSSFFPRQLRNERGEVGLRVSPHPTVKELFGFFDGCLVATSANRSGHPPAKTLPELEELASFNLPVLSAGKAMGEKPSTVVRVNVDGTLDILREGAISQKDIEERFKDG